MQVFRAPISAVGNVHGVLWHWLHGRHSGRTPDIITDDGSAHSDASLPLTTTTTSSIQPAPGRSSQRRVTWGSCDGDEDDGGGYSRRHTNSNSSSSSSSSSSSDAGGGSEAPATSAAPQPPVTLTTMHIPKLALGKCKQAPPKQTIIPWDSSDDEDSASEGDISPRSDGSWEDWAAYRDQEIFDPEHHQEGDSSTSNGNQSIKITTNNSSSSSSSHTTLRKHTPTMLPDFTNNNSSKSHSDYGSPMPDEGTKSLVPAPFSFTEIHGMVSPVPVWLTWEDSVPGWEGWTPWHTCAVTGLGTAWRAAQKQHMAALLNKMLPFASPAGLEEESNEQDSNSSINYKYDCTFINRIMASDSSKRSISSSTIQPYISPTPRSSSSSWGDIIPTYRSLSTTCSNMTTYYHATNINKIEIISNAITIARSRRCLSSSSSCITTSSQSGFSIWSSKEELAHALNTGNVDRPALAALQLAATAACAHHWGAWAREALDLPGLTSAGGRLGAALIHAWLDTVGKALRSHGLEAVGQLPLTARCAAEDAWREQVDKLAAAHRTQLVVAAPLEAAAVAEAEALWDAAGREQSVF